MRSPQTKNLVYNYFRTYDPSTGRYLESDPSGLDGGLNTYGYVRANPLSFVDPLGLDASAISRVWPIAGGAAAADGPAPIGDAIALGLVLGAIIYDACTSEDDSECRLFLQMPFQHPDPHIQPRNWVRCLYKCPDGSTVILEHTAVFGCPQTTQKQ